MPPYGSQQTPYNETNFATPATPAIGSNSAFHKPDEPISSAYNQHSQSHRSHALHQETSTNNNSPATHSQQSQSALGHHQSQPIQSHAATSPLAQTPTIPSSALATAEIAAPLSSQAITQTQSLYPLIPPQNQPSQSYQQSYYPPHPSTFPSAYNYQTPNPYSAQPFAQYQSSQYPSVAPPIVPHSYPLQPQPLQNPAAMQSSLDASQYRSYANPYNYPPYQPPPGPWHP